MPCLCNIWATSVETRHALSLSHEYTDKPVIVIPKLVDGDGNELVFSVDFSVKYKNNTKIGNAKIIVSGEGNYKGVKKIGFDIVNRIGTKK
jgi:hypothetical protein